jgi:hypothetical protein
MGRRSDRARIARLQRMAALPARIGLARSGDARALLGGNSPAQKAADARRMIILGRIRRILSIVLTNLILFFLVASPVAQVGLKSMHVVLQYSH